MSGKSESHFSHINGKEHPIFWIILLLGEISGVTMAILCGIWMGVYRGGYEWSASLVFNYHPLFMSIGMIFLYGNGDE